ncbi:MAG: sortase [Chloroflexota bacterium]
MGRRGAIAILLLAASLAAGGLLAYLGPPRLRRAPRPLTASPVVGETPWARLAATLTSSAATLTSPKAVQAKATAAGGLPQPGGSPIASPPSPAAPTAPTRSPTNPAGPGPTRPASGGSPAPAEAIGQIVIARIGLQAPIVPVSWHLREADGLVEGEWDAPADVVAHHRGTAPLGGRGNCVLSGHSSDRQGGVFQRLHELRRGDRIVLVDDLGQQFTYTVEEITSVPELGIGPEQRRANARVMLPTDDARLTLITCWPDWAYTHRLIVVARPA